MLFELAFECVVQPAIGIRNIDNRLMVVILKVCALDFLFNTHSAKMLIYFLTTYDASRRDSWVWYSRQGDRPNCHSFTRRSYRTLYFGIIIIAYQPDVPMGRTNL